jgi:hypothetical protein
MLRKPGEKMSLVLPQTELVDSQAGGASRPIKR